MYALVEIISKLLFVLGYILHPHVLAVAERVVHLSSAWFALGIPLSFACICNAFTGGIGLSMMSFMFPFSEDMKDFNVL